MYRKLMFNQNKLLKALSWRFSKHASDPRVSDTINLKYSQSKYCGWNSVICIRFIKSLLIICNASLILKLLQFNEISYTSSFSFKITWLDYVSEYSILMDRGAMEHALNPRCTVCIEKWKQELPMNMMQWIGTGWFLHRRLLSYQRYEF